MINPINNETHSWGKIEILTKFDVSPQGNVYVRTITVYPKCSLSYQSHKLRGEHWKFVQGRGTVILDGEENTVVSGSGINIPVGTKHRVINDNETQDLIFVEISSGQFDENDIERFEDDYGRVK